MLNSHLESISYAVKVGKLDAVTSTGYAREENRSTYQPSL